MDGEPKILDRLLQAANRAQAVKVLRVLLAEAKRTETTRYAEEFLARVIRDTGLGKKKE